MLGIDQAPVVGLTVVVVAEDDVHNTPTVPPVGIGVTVPEIVTKFGYVDVVAEAVIDVISVLTKLDGEEYPKLFLPDTR